MRAVDIPLEVEDGERGALGACGRKAESWKPRWRGERESWKL